MFVNNPLFDRLGLLKSGIKQTIHQIKAIEPDTSLSYTFSDAPHGVYFIRSRDIKLLVERYEAYEALLTSIRDCDSCGCGCKAAAAEVLTEAVNPDDSETFDDDFLSAEDTDEYKLSPCLYLFGDIDPEAIDLTGFVYASDIDDEPDES